MLRCRADTSFLTNKGRWIQAWQQLTQPWIIIIIVKHHKQSQQDGRLRQASFFLRVVMPFLLIFWFDWNAQGRNKNTGTDQRFFEDGCNRQRNFLMVIDGRPEQTKRSKRYWYTCIHPPGTQGPGSTRSQRTLQLSRQDFNKFLHVATVVD